MNLIHVTADDDFAKQIIIAMTYFFPVRLEMAAVSLPLHPVVGETIAALANGCPLGMQGSGTAPSYQRSNSCCILNL